MLVQIMSHLGKHWTLAAFLIIPIQYLMFKCLSLNIRNAFVLTGMCSLEEIVTDIQVTGLNQSLVPLSNQKEAETPLISSGQHFQRTSSVVLLHISNILTFTMCHVKEVLQKEELQKPSSAPRYCEV